MAEVSKFQRQKRWQALRLTLPYGAALAMPLATDFLLICLSSLVASFLYDTLALQKPIDVGSSLGIGILAGTLFCGLGLNLGIYWKPFGAHVRNVTFLIFTSWAIVGLSLSTALFLFKAGVLFSRADAATFFLVGLVALLANHAICRILLSRLANEGSLIGRRAVVIGEAGELQKLGHDYLRGIGYDEARRFPLKFSTSTDSLADLEDGIEKALVYARRARAKDVVLAVGWQQKELLKEISKLIRITPLPVLLLPDQATRSLLSKHMPWSRSSSFSIELKRAPLNNVEQALKRLCDVIGASLGLVLLLPVFMVVAILIKVDSDGPVLFRQRRAGFDRKIFWIYKFRSMKVLEDGAVIRQAARRDARVTRVGAILRRTSIDEIPQLLNVLRGDMSLIGPRPHALAHDSEYQSVVAQYASRHHVKPGITGWAQVHGLRGETANLKAMADRVEKDLWYIDNWSIWLDLNILLRTSLSLRSKNAY